MRNFDITVDHYAEAHQWLLDTFGDERVRVACIYAGPRVQSRGELPNMNYVATASLIIDDEDMALQFKLCWGHIVLS